MATKQDRIRRIQERREVILDEAKKVRAQGKSWKELSLEDRLILVSADIINNEDRLEQFEQELAQEQEVPTEENLTASVFKGAKCFCCGCKLESGESSILSANLLVAKAEQPGRKMPPQAHFMKKVAALRVTDFQAAMCCRMCNPQVESWLAENLPSDSDRNNFRLHSPMNIIKQWAKENVDTAKRNQDSLMQSLDERIAVIKKNLNDLRSQRDSIRGVVKKKQEKTQEMNNNIKNALGFLSPLSSNVVSLPITGTDGE